MSRKRKTRQRIAALMKGGAAVIFVAAVVQHTEWLWLFLKEKAENFILSIRR